LPVGSYAIYYYLPHSRRRSMTETVARWRDFLPEYLVLPRRRTVGWLRNNPWFENEVLPNLPTRSGRVLDPEALHRTPRCDPAKDPNRRR
jgi:uracil-DNA glycosylase